MIRLSLADVFKLHERIIEQSGGSLGVRSSEIVESALAQPFATFDGHELYPTLVDKQEQIILQVADGSQTRESFTQWVNQHVSKL